MAQLSSMRPPQIVRGLERCGLKVVRQSGGHVMLFKPGLARPVVTAMHNKEISPGTIRSILNQAQVTIEEFLDKL